MIIAAWGHAKIQLISFKVPLASRVDLLFCVPGTGISLLSLGPKGCFFWVTMVLSAGFLQSKKAWKHADQIQRCKAFKDVGYIPCHTEIEK
jgi:hypothetical protein